MENICYEILEPVRAKFSKPIMINNREIILAFFGEREPLAISLSFFSGCFLSFSISNKSFIKYIPEATKLKEKNRSIEIHNVSPVMPPNIQNNKSVTNVNVNENRSINLNFMKNDPKNVNSG